MKHLPVMVDEVLQAFADTTLHTFFDATFGCGGHATALLNSHPEIECYIACDCDQQALNNLPNHPAIIPVHANFSTLSNTLSELRINSLDGALFDLGLSSAQLDDPTRGFSFQHPGPLDMRLDRSQTSSAADLLRTSSERYLGEIIRDYGEERQWRKVAKVIAHQKKSLTSTDQLAEILLHTLRRHHHHPATRTFQALRIAVNDELNSLEQALEQALKLCQGPIAVISFHSLEDRIVKKLFHSHHSGKLLRPKREEVVANRRARSAKLRIANPTRPRRDSNTRPVA